MSLKRHNTSSPEPDDDDRPAKRPRPLWVDDFDTFEHPTTHEQPRVDVTSGQHSAFPGLDDDDGELIYDEPENGLQYLRMVRLERRNALSVLVAEGKTKTLATDEGDQDDEDYDKEDYHPDRAWVAVPDQTFGEVSDNASDAQDFYYLSLLDHFARLQARLRISPPLSAIELLPSSQPISFPPETAKARDKWKHVTLVSDPSPTQLACMDPESVQELVKLLTESLTGIVKARIKTKIKRLGGWIWATLARCRDLGELSSEEVAEVRALGKKTVQLLKFVRKTKTQIAEQRQDVEPTIEEDELVGSDEEDLEQAKARMASMLEATESVPNGEEVADTIVEMNVDEQIRMVLDMTTTIIGEVYGQRDLLEHRDIWQ